MGSGGRRAAVLVSAAVLLGSSVAAQSVAAAVTTADCTIFASGGAATGTSGDDVICGSEGADLIRGYGGNDTIFGLGGDDYIDAGSGADSVQGGYGDDEVLLGSGNDTGSGGPGKDRMFGQDGDDAVLGSSGDDSLSGGAGVDALNGGYGVDYCRKDGVDTLTSCFYDTSLPQVSWVSIKPSTVDTSGAPAVLTLRTRVTDSGTGVDFLVYEFSRRLADGSFADVPRVAFFGIARGADFGCTPDGRAPEPVSGATTICRMSGNEKDGVYEVKLLLPQWTRKGTYVLTGVRLKDSAGNERVISSQRLAERGLDVRFAQTGAGDPYAPRLRDLQVITPTLDSSQSARVLTVRARITDNLSGVASGVLVWARYTFDSTGAVNGFRSPELAGFVLESDPKTCPTSTPTVEELLSADRVASCRESGGTRTDAWYRIWTVVPRWTGQGTYHLIRAGVEDRAGNDRSLYGDEVADAGLSRSFKQAGTGDEIAPTVSSIELLTGAVDSGVDAAQVRVRIRVKDGLSGLSDVRLYFWPEGGQQYLEVYATDVDCGVITESCRVSGTDHDGVYEATGWLPAHAAAGTWKLQRIDVYDKAANNRYYLRSDGLTASFTNS